MDNQHQNLLSAMIQYCEASDKASFQTLIKELQPYDVATLFADLPEALRPPFISLMEAKQIAELLQELEPLLQADVLRILGKEGFTKVHSLMESDDLVDLFNEIFEDQVDDWLNVVKESASQPVKNLMRYPPDTAGGLMTDRYVWIRSYYTVREAVDKLKSFAEIAENLYYLYVLDENKKLTGVVSFRDLLLANLDDRIEDIMFSRVISVPVHMDQEEVANTIERYDFLSVPVVDDEHRLLGIITVDDVIDVFIREADEDISKLSATSGKTIDFTTGALSASFRRLPWLILLLILGFLSGTIISSFEQTLDQVVALAFFLPMITGMTGNTGTQSLAIVVRGLAAIEPGRKYMVKLLVRELRVGIMIGLVCGIIVSILSYFWQGDVMLGLVVGSSLFITLIIGTMAGTIIPLILHKLRVDPAIASGPLITTLNDIFSLFIYFGIAATFISYLI